MCLLEKSLFDNLIEDRRSLRDTDSNLPQLLPGHIHVWRIDLDVSDSVLTSIQQLLSADELDRASRFHFPRHQRYFIAGRAAMRLLVGGYVGLDPASVQFRYTREGKPLLERDPATQSGRFATPDCRFNLTHSRDVALFAITMGRNIGVDIEFINSAFQWRDVAETICTESEIATLSASAPMSHAKMFFDMWTRKEAYVKAHGLGFSMPVNNICVWPSPKLSDEWLLESLNIDPEYSAAIAVRGRIESAHWLRLNW